MYVYACCQASEKPNEGQASTETVQRKCTHAHAAVGGGGGAYLRNTLLTIMPLPPYLEVIVN